MKCGCIVGAVWVLVWESHNGMLTWSTRTHLDCYRRTNGTTLSVGRFVRCSWRTIFDRFIRMAHPGRTGATYRYSSIFDCSIEEQRNARMSVLIGLTNRIPALHRITLLFESIFIVSKQIINLESRFLPVWSSVWYYRVHITCLILQGWYYQSDQCGSDSVVLSSCYQAGGGIQFEAYNRNFRAPLGTVRHRRCFEANEHFSEPGLNGRCDLKATTKWSLCKNNFWRALSWTSLVELLFWELFCELLYELWELLCKIFFLWDFSV